MKKETLTHFEQELLNKMNTKAMLIVQIEEWLQDLKLPMDKSVLYDMEEDHLTAFLEMLASAKENRKKYGKVETNG